MSHTKHLILNTANLDPTSLPFVLKDGPVLLVETRHDPGAVAFMTYPCDCDDAPSYPHEWHHLHGKAISGLRHSHPLREGEDPSDPDHRHEGDDNPENVPQGTDRRGWGRPIYPDQEEQL